MQSIIDGKVHYGTGGGMNIASVFSYMQSQWGPSLIEVVFHNVSAYDTYLELKALHTTYPGNNMCLECGRKSGLWVLHEMINKAYAENMKKIVGAV